MKWDFLLPKTDEYRSRWSYRLGDAKVLLPRILAEEDVDVFIHDSLHTATHMLFEYATARALMPEKTLLLSDDIGWNNSFDGFLAINGLTGYAPFSNPNVGLAVNLFNKFEHDAGIGIVRSDDAI